MELDNFQKNRLLVIDSNLIFREGFKRVLELNSNLQIVAEGERGEQLLPLYKEYQPDAVILDTNLSFNENMEALRELTLSFPGSKVLIFTINDEFSHVSQAIKEGAWGYLLKEMDATSIIAAIHSVIRDEAYLHPKIIKGFLSEFRELSKREKRGNFFQLDIKRPSHLLTPREAEVLQLLAEGHSNITLGDALGISDKTVKNHVSSILKKMDSTDRTQAVVRALKNGWIELK